MNFYDPAYYKNPLAIKHVDWHQSRINFQAWPYPSATEVVTEQLRKLVVTGDKSFMDKLSTEFVVKDLLNYSYIKKSLENHPKWKGDLSVPQSGDPFVRTEVIEV
jgi:NitT/TauT family transport system substrate-binding protein